MTGEFRVRCDGRPVGQLSFAEAEGQIELELVIVVASQRSRGLGSDLLRRLLLLADALGKPVLTTARPIGSSSPEILARLVGFYERFGFRVIDRGLMSVRMRREPQ